MKDPVLIKSNKYGITIYFDPDMPYEELLPEVREKFESSAHFFNHADMAVEFEGRTFTEEEEQRMAEVIQDAAKIRILCIIEKNTYTERLHKRMLDESLETIHERDGQFYKGTLRGRQILESEKKHRYRRRRRRRRQSHIQRQCRRDGNHLRNRSCRRRRRLRCSHSSTSYEAHKASYWR